MIFAATPAVTGQFEHPPEVTTGGKPDRLKLSALALCVVVTVVWVPVLTLPCGTVTLAAEIAVTQCGTQVPVPLAGQTNPEEQLFPQFPPHPSLVLQVFVHVREHEYDKS